MRKLSKKELSSITGGFFASCYADCGLNEDGSSDWQVWCSVPANGSCNAVDDMGCTASNGESHACANGPHPLDVGEPTQIIGLG